MPSELVNSVISSPQPPSPRITRRNSVSVTPAMGAKTVAGRIDTSLNLYSAGIAAEFACSAGRSFLVRMLRARSVKVGLSQLMLECSDKSRVAGWTEISILGGVATVETRLGCVGSPRSDQSQTL